MIKLLIVDDHPRVREALARVLEDPEAGIEVVGVAAFGKDEPPHPGTLLGTTAGKDRNA